MIFVNKGFKRDANKSSTPGLEGWRCQYHQQRGRPKFVKLGCVTLRGFLQMS